MPLPLLAELTGWRLDAADQDDVARVSGLDRAGLEPLRGRAFRGEVWAVPEAAERVR